jgi:mono/diheme cytochrome c family protein
MQSRLAWTIAILVVAVIVIGILLMRFNLTALEEPGRLETLVADRGRHFLIHRASRRGIPPPPGDKKASIASGSVLYGLECGMCHGPDGHAQTPMGKWMYPRAADLTRADVQRYSDDELFWIIQNGIRLSGMPAFGKVESEQHIWNLVHYVRTLPGASGRTPSTK